LPKRPRLVGFFQDCGEGLPYYVTELRRLYDERGWKRSTSTGDAEDFVPHDVRVHEWGSDKTRVEQMIAGGLRPNIPTEMGIDDGINAVRAILPICEFDEEGCSEGIKVLKAYRKEWDENMGRWRDRPRHDWASDGADAFRYLAAAYRDLVPPPEPKKPKQIEIKEQTLDEIVAQTLKNRRYRGNRI
jgi:hypothetical protein